jgi:hypothetical protein
VAEPQGMHLHDDAPNLKGRPGFQNRSQTSAHAWLATLLGPVEACPRAFKPQPTSCLARVSPPPSRAVPTWRRCAQGDGVGPDSPRVVKPFHQADLAASVWDAIKQEQVER